MFAGRHQINPSRTGHYFVIITDFYSEQNMILLSIAIPYAPHTLPLPGRPEMPGEERWDAFTICIHHMQHYYLNRGPLLLLPQTIYTPTHSSNGNDGRALSSLSPINSLLRTGYLLLSLSSACASCFSARQPYAQPPFLLHANAICHCTLYPPHGYTRISSQWLHDAAEVPILLTR